MGACGSSEQGGGGGEFQPTMEEVQRSKVIEKMLRDEEKKLSKAVKVRSRFFLYSSEPADLGTNRQILLLGTLPLSSNRECQI